MQCGWRALWPWLTVVYIDCCGLNSFMPCDCGAQDVVWNTTFDKSLATVLRMGKTAVEVLSFQNFGENMEKIGAALKAITIDDEEVDDMAAAKPAASDQGDGNNNDKVC